MIKLGDKVDIVNNNVKIRKIKFDYKTIFELT